MLRSPLLESLAWLDHGFGTREGPLSQEGMANLRQIHSAKSFVADHPGCIGEGDALITAEPGLPVSIRTADCLPVLLADPEHHVVAAVHAGWRGTAAHIAVETLARMEKEFGTRPAQVRAAIGPGIGACCYAVGPEVAERFGREGACRLDLAAENIRQLIAAGVESACIEHLARCTACEPAHFHSWRRDRDTAGRMISFIAAKA